MRTKSIQKSEKVYNIYYYQLFHQDTITLLWYIVYITNECLKINIIEVLFALMMNQFEINKLLQIPCTVVVMARTQNTWYDCADRLIQKFY